MDNLVYLGLGSNLQNPKQQIKSVYQIFTKCKNITILAKSKFYYSKPLGPQDQPDYVNSALAIRTNFDAEELISKIKGIEQNMQRIKLRHWGERNIDIDILFFNQEKVNKANLILPHPEIANRDFVLLPLLDIADKNLKLWLKQKLEKLPDIQKLVYASDY